jgi:hypothetical protein
VSRASQIIVLAEDKRHQNFVRRYLQRLGYENRAIRMQDLPSGRGSGEQWVRERFANAVATYRGRHPQTALVVVIDADMRPVQERFRQLPSNRSEDESIAILVPKRHIETWILCLNEERVDERTDYRSRHIDGLIKPAAETLFKWSRATATPSSHCVESLQTAFPELQRIPEA